ncbi:unnamed protein product [Pylaiella littoralis]
MVNSPFEEVDLKICVSLLPSDIGDIYAGIRRNIYQFLMRYNESLGGVLLAVSELSFDDGDGAAREGRIVDEMPHIHFDVKAKAQVFRPQPGHILEGRVNKVTSTHVGMLVCGIFNASVASESMGEGFRFDLAAREWRKGRSTADGGGGGDGDGDGDEVIAVDCDTKFVVTRMHEAAGLISIEGSLEGLPAEKEGKIKDGEERAATNPNPSKRQAVAAAAEGEEEDAAAAKAARKKARKAAKLAAKASKKMKVKTEL